MTGDLWRRLWAWYTPARAYRVTRWLYGADADDLRRMRRS